MDQQKHRCLVLGMGQSAYYLDEGPATSSVPSKSEDTRDETIVLQATEVPPAMSGITIESGKHLVVAKEWYMDDLGDIVFIGRSLHLSGDDVSPFISTHRSHGSWADGAHYDYYVTTEVFEKIKASTNGIFA